MADEIGRAFTKVGGSAGALNLSFEKTASWIAVLSSRTREGAETIGQSVKSILARVQSLTETGFDEEDGTQINDVAKALATVGISLTDTSGQFVNFGTIMDQLGAKWKTLDSRQKAYLSTTVAGTYQQSRFLNLMEGYSDTIPLYQKSLEAAGTTQAKYNLYLEGTQAHLDRLKANMQDLWANTFNSGGLQVGINALSGLISIITKAVETFGFLPVAVFTTTAAFALFNNTVRTFVGSTGSAMLNWLGVTQLGMTKLSLGINRVAYSMGLSASAARIFTLSIVGLTRAFLPLLAISAAAWGIQKIFSAIAASRQATKQATELNYDNVNSLRTQQDELKGLSAEYANLKLAQDAGTATNEQKERLLQLQTELVDKYGVSATGINDEGKAYTNSLIAIKARNDALSDEIKLENEKNLTKLRAKDSENTKKYQSELEDTEKYLEKKKKLQEQLAEVQSDIANGTYKTMGRRDVRQNFNISDTDRLQYNSSQIVELFNQQISLIDDKLSESTDTLQTALSDRITVLSNASNEYIGQMKNISDGERLYVDNLIKSVAQNGQGIDQQIDTVRSAIDQLSNSGFDDLLSRFNDAKAAFYKTPTNSNEGLMKQLKVQAEDLVDSLATGIPNIEQFKVSVLGLFDTSGEYVDTSSEVAKIQKEMSESFKSTASEVSSLNSVLSDLNAGNALTADQVAELILQYPSLADNIAKVADGWTIEKSAVDELRLAKIQQQEDTINAEKNATTQTLKSTLARLQIYSIELDALDKRDNRMNAISDLGKKKLDTPAIGNPLLGGISAFMKGAVDDYNKEVDTAISSVKEIDQLYNQLDALGKLIADPSYGVSTSKKDKPKKTPKDKDAPTTSDNTQSAINAINAESEARAKLNEQIKSRADELKDEGKYEEAIAKTTTLLASQRKELALLSKANTDLKAKQNALDAGSSYNLSKMVDANGELTTSFHSTFDALGSKSAQEALQTLVDKYAAYTKAIKDNSSAMDANKTAQKDTQQGIDDLKLQYTQAYLEKRAKLVDAYDKQIEDSKKRQSLYDENSTEFNAETQVQIKLLAQKEDYYTREIANTEARLKQGKLTNDQIKALNEYLQTNKDALLDAAVAQAEYAKQWESNVEDAAQEALDAIEEYYQKQSELAQDALDKELSAYEEFIDERKKLLNRQNDTEDYNKQRSKLQTEELEIRKQIDVLSLDDSIEAKAKKVDLEKQLSDKLQEIDDLQTDRTRQQRNDNLDDLQDAKQDEIKLEKEATDKKWKDALASDANYSAIRQAQLEGNTAKLQTALQAFAANVQTYMDGIGKSIDMNITDKMAELAKFQNSVQSINSAAQTSPSTPSTSSDQSSSLASDPAYVQKKKDWQTYLSNKQKAEQEFKDTGKWDQSLANANNSLRLKYPDFKDGTYAFLKSLNLFSAKSGGMTPSWGDTGKIGVLHEDEMIANKLQTKDLIKVTEWTKNIVPWISKLDISKILVPKLNLESAGAPIYNLNFHIDTVTGDKNGAKTLYSELVKGIRKKGGII